MAIRFCARCNGTFPESAEHCPHCGESFSVPEPLPAGGLGAEVFGWGTVRTGLGLVFVGTVVLLAAGTALLLSSLLVWGAPFDAGVALAFGLIVAGLFVGVVLAVSGGCMGVAAPAPSGARGWAVCYCVAVAAVVVLLTASALSAAGPPARETLLARLLWAGRHAVMATMTVCFMNFLGAVALALGDEALARGARGYAAAAILFQALWAAAEAFGGQPGPDDLAAVVLVFLALALVLGVWFLGLVHQAWAAVTRGMAG